MQPTHTPHTLGKAKVSSRLGLGMAALGRPGYMTLGHADDLNRNYDQAAMERHAHEVMDAAWKAGVRYFDTARSYGAGEKFLGTWLRSRNIPHAEITVASKWGYTYTAGWKVNAETHEVKDHSLAVLQRQWRESDEILGDYLDIYQIHSTTLETGVLEDTSVLKELAHLKSKGVRIGLTLTGAEQAKTLQRAQEVFIDGVRLFDVVQATWNLLEPSVGPALSNAHQSGITVTIKEALANGRLTERNHQPEFCERLKWLKEESSRLNCTVDALALAACLAQPFVDIVLSGAATTQHLQSNLKASSVKIDPGTFAVLQKIAEPAPIYWAKRKLLPWT